MKATIIRTVSLFALVALVACGVDTTVDGSDPNATGATTPDGTGLDGDDDSDDNGDHVSGGDDSGGDDNGGDDTGGDDTGGDDAGPAPEPDAGPGEPEPCPTGYSGEGCASCADGFQDIDEDGVCNLSCAAADLFADDCDVNGACLDDIDSGERLCVCDEGFAGALCEACAPGFDADAGGCVLGAPPADRLLVWLDADDDDSILHQGGGDLASTSINEWRDTRGGVLPYYFSALGDHQPERKLPGGLNGRRVVRFDGVDDWMQLFGGPLFVANDGFPLVAEDAYTIIIVGVAHEGGDIILSGTRDGLQGLRVASLSEGNLRFLHRSPYSNNQTPGNNDLYTSTGAFSRVAPQIMTLRRTPDFHEVGVGYGVDDVTVASEQTTADPFAQSMNLTMGRRSPTDGTGQAYLKGDIAEVLIYERALTQAELDYVRGYLQAKWDLAAPLM